MNRSIIFFDIDGTLISEETKRIPESAKDAIKKLKEKGHLTFINTGRPICEITPTLRDLGFDGYLCSCGSHIEYNGETLLYKALEEDLCREIALDMVKFNLEGILEGRYKIYWDKPENIKNPVVLQIMEQHKQEGFFKYNSWYDDNIQFDKLVIFLSNNSDFQGFHNKYKDIFDFIKRDEKFYELVPKGYSKATGIEFIINHLDIPHENTYAIGDSTNDLTMLQYAHNSIAMGNSNKALFDLVSYITDTVDEDGIYNALKHYNLI